MTLLQLIAHLKEIYEEQGNREEVVVYFHSLDVTQLLDKFDIKTTETQLQFWV